VIFGVNFMVCLMSTVGKGFQQLVGHAQL